MSTQSEREPDHIRKQGDTADPLELTLKDANGAYPIPSGATPYLTMRGRYRQAVVVESAAMVPDPDQSTNPGICRYYFEDVDVANDGMFDFEVALVLSNGKPIRFPRDEEEPYGLLSIEKNLTADLE